MVSRSKISLIIILFFSVDICISMERPPSPPAQQNALTPEMQYLSPENKKKDESKSFKSPTLNTSQEVQMSSTASTATGSILSIPSNLFVYKVVFINKYGVPETVERILPAGEVPGAVLADETAKVKFILTKLLKGEGINEKPNLKTYFPAGSDIIKCEISVLPSEEGPVKKLYLEFTPDVVKDIDESALENMHKQICFTLKESGMEGFSVFEFRVKDEKGVLRSLGYFIKKGR